MLVVRGVNLPLRAHRGEEELWGQDEALGLASKCGVLHHRQMFHEHLFAEAALVPRARGAHWAQEQPQPWLRQEGQMELEAQAGYDAKLFWHREMWARASVTGPGGGRGSFYQLKLGRKGKGPQHACGSHGAPSLLPVIARAPLCWHQHLREITLSLSWCKAAESAESRKLFTRGPAEQRPSASCLHAPTTGTFLHNMVGPVPGFDAKTPTRKSSVVFKHLCAVRAAATPHLTWEI